MTAEERARVLADAFRAAAREVGLAEVIDDSELSVFRLDNFVAVGWPDGPDKGTVSSMVPSMGAYLGEMMVRHLGGTWMDSSTTNVGLAVDFPGGPVDPFTPIERRFIGTNRNEIAMYYTAVRSVLRGTLPKQPGLLSRLLRRG